MKTPEIILVFERALLPSAWLASRAALSLSELQLRKCLIKAAPAWRPRALVETDPRCKQAIPYAIVADAGGKLAVYPRQGSEKRLHGLWSAGAGGHVNPCDRNHSKDLLESLKNGLIRELEEEFYHPPEPAAIRLLGIVNEEVSAVGQVHLGIVFLVEFADSAGLVPAAELAGLRWLKPVEAKAVNLELWSRLALSLFLGGNMKGCPGGQMTG